MKCPHGMTDEGAEMWWREAAAANAEVAFCSCCGGPSPKPTDWVTPELCRLCQGEPEMTNEVLWTQAPDAVPV
jgi:hypothetical protein